MTNLTCNDNLYELIEYIVSVPICKNCMYWYKNQKDKNLNTECPWRNNDVPKPDDYCSRWRDDI